MQIPHEAFCRPLVKGERRTTAGKCDYLHSFLWFVIFIWFIFRQSKSFQRREEEADDIEGEEEEQDGKEMDVRGKYSHTVVIDDDFDVEEYESSK